MDAPATQYEEAAGLVSGDTAALGRLCGITDTTALGMLFTIKIS